MIALTPLQFVAEPEPNFPSLPVIEIEVSGRIVVAGQPAVGPARVVVLMFVIPFAYYFE